MTREMLKEIIKKELGWRLNDKGNHLITTNEVLYAREYGDGFYMSIQDKVGKTVNIHLYKGCVTTERQVKAFIRKYKNIKRALKGTKMKQALQLLFAELNYLRDKQFLCRQVRKQENNYDEKIELLLKAIEYLEMAIKKGE